ncbi:hypothetical protein Tco_0229757 [Tanacetum coccineum]
MGGSYYSFPCSILSIGKDCKTSQRYPDVPTTSWRISLRSMDSFQRLTPKSPSSWHRPLAPNLYFYDHVSFHLKFAEASSVAALQVLIRLGSIFTSVYAAVQKLKKALGWSFSSAWLTIPS